MITKYLQYIAISFLTSLWLFVSSASGRDFQLEVHDGTLNLWANDISLQKVLAALERESRIQIEYFLQPNETISADLENVPLEEGIGLLLRNFNHSLVYTGNGKGSTAAIETIYIYSRTGRKSTQVVGKTGVKKTVSIDHIPELRDLAGKMKLYNTLPKSAGALAGMDLIDPLMRFTTNRPESEINHLSTDTLPTPHEVKHGE